MMGKMLYMITSAVIVVSFLALCDESEVDLSTVIVRKTLGLLGLIAGSLAAGRLPELERRIRRAWERMSGDVWER